MILPILLASCWPWDAPTSVSSPAARQRTYLLLGAGLILLAVFKQGEGLPDYQGFVENIEGDTETTLEITKEPAFFAIRWVADRFPGQRVLVALLLYALLGIDQTFAAIRRLTDLWFWRWPSTSATSMAPRPDPGRAGVAWGSCCSASGRSRSATCAALSCRRPSPRCCFTTRPS